MENKEAKPNNKPKYEPPTALSLDNLQKGSGVCMDGSAAMAMPGCNTGNIAGNNCEDGNSPDSNCKNGSSVI